MFHLITLSPLAIINIKLHAHLDATPPFIDIIACVISKEAASFATFQTQLR